MSRPLRSSNTPLTKVAQADPYEAQWQGAPLSSQSLPRKHQEVDKRSFNSFDEFYACYLSELSHPVNRGLHVAGTVISILIAFFIVLRVFVIASSPPSFLLYLPLALLPDYGFAWIGHLLFERNKVRSAGC